MPADGTLAAITPAEISASLPRQRQLAKDCTPPQRSNFGKNLLLYQFGVRYSIDDDGIADRHAHCSVEKY